MDGRRSGQCRKAPQPQNVANGHGLGWVLVAAAVLVVVGIVVSWRTGPSRTE